jgi:hypothetical protein
MLTPLDLRNLSKILSFFLDTYDGTDKAADLITPACILKAKFEAFRECNGTQADLLFKVLETHADTTPVRCQGHDGILIDFHDGSALFISEERFLSFESVDKVQ